MNEITRFRNAMTYLEIIQESYKVSCCICMGDIVSYKKKYTVYKSHGFKFINDTCRMPTGKKITSTKITLYISQNCMQFKKGLAYRTNK